MAGKDTLISLIKVRSKVSTQIRAQNRKKYLLFSIINTQLCTAAKILAISTCKSAYIKGYAKN